MPDHRQRYFEAGATPEKRREAQYERMGEYVDRATAYAGVIEQARTADSPDKAKEILENFLNELVRAVPERINPAIIELETISQDNARVNQRRDQLATENAPEEQQQAVEAEFWALGARREKLEKDPEVRFFSYAFWQLERLVQQAEVMARVQKLDNPKQEALEGLSEITENTFTANDFSDIIFDNLAITFVVAEDSDTELLADGSLGKYLLDFPIIIVREGDQQAVTLRHEQAHQMTHYQAEDSGSTLRSIGKRLNGYELLEMRAQGKLDQMTDAQVEYMRRRLLSLDTNLIAKGLHAELIPLAYQNPPFTISPRAKTFKEKLFGRVLPKDTKILPLSDILGSMDTVGTLIVDIYDQIRAVAATASKLGDTEVASHLLAVRLESARLVNQATRDLHIAAQAAAQLAGPALDNVNAAAVLLKPDQYSQLSPFMRQRFGEPYEVAERVASVHYDICIQQECTKKTILNLPSLRSAADSPHTQALIFDMQKTEFILERDLLTGSDTLIQVLELAAILEEARNTLGEECISEDVTYELVRLWAERQIEADATAFFSNYTKDSFQSENQEAIAAAIGLQFMTLKEEHRDVAIIRHFYDQAIAFDSAAATAMRECTSDQFVDSLLTS